VNERGTRIRVSLVALGLALLLPTSGFAEWQIRPFLGATFGGETTLFDLDHAAGERKFTVGVNGVLLGDVVGIEADLGHIPGFFQRASQNLILGSRVTTLTGNVVLALPRRMTQYTLRPYVVGGAGVMYARSEDELDVLTVSRTLAALDVGGGVTGFFTDRIGVSWDVRYFRSLGGGNDNGLSFGAEKLSFWRAIMAVAIRTGKVRP
jgi:hypothetical protein